MKRARRTDAPTGPQPIIGLLNTPQTKYKTINP
jgi:hypothetical protein